MLQKNIHQILIFILLLATTLACRLVSGLGDSKATLESAATEAKEGMNMLGTARALVTEVGSNQMIQTAQALATEVGESGMLQTAIAVATQEGPGVMKTAKAIATQEGPGLQETAQAAMTQIAGSMDEAPPDIPIIAGETSNFLGTEFMVSYMTPLSLPEVLDFYKNQMPAMDWTFIERGYLETENMAALNYEKPERSAAITLNTNPLDGGTVVLILLAEK